MERHSLRALLSVGLLVVLAWIGIALAGKLHNGGGVVAVFILWAVLVAALLASALWSIVQARHARLERRSEATDQRK